MTKEGSSDSDSKQTCSGECMTNYDAKSKCKSTVSTTNDCTKKLSNRHVDGVCCQGDKDSKAATGRKCKHPQEGTCIDTSKDTCTVDTLRGKCPHGDSKVLCCPSGRVVSKEGGSNQKQIKH